MEKTGKLYIMTYVVEFQCVRFSLEIFLYSGREDTPFLSVNVAKFEWKEHFFVH